MAERAWLALVPVVRGGRVAARVGRHRGRLFSSARLQLFAEPEVTPSFSVSLTHPIRLDVVLTSALLRDATSRQTVRHRRYHSIFPYANRLTAGAGASNRGQQQPRKEKKHGLDYPSLRRQQSWWMHREENVVAQPSLAHRGNYHSRGNLPFRHTQTTFDFLLLRVKMD